jgi:DNA-binding transcriptional ArsR family regulator
MANVDLASVAALIGDPRRAAMLDALLAGRALAAGELARVAGVSPATASAHLSCLLKGGLVTMSAQGRHRYYQLMGSDVATALEALAQIAPPRQVTSLRQASEVRSLKFARTCYDHLAGHVGVGVHDRLLDRGWLIEAIEGYSVTSRGVQGLTVLGVDVGAAKSARRSFARPCLDGTERRSHLAGGLAAALTAAFLDARWLERKRVDSRSLRLTSEGVVGLQRHFGWVPTASG